MHPIFFIAGTLGIYLVSKIFQAFYYSDFLLFPAVVIFFLLVSERESRDIWYVVAAVIWWDLFSGFEFGFMTAGFLLIAPRPRTRPREEC